MKRILFRADAKPEIGTGDLMSLIYLSRYFQERKWETHFIIRDYKIGVMLLGKHWMKNVAILPGNISVQEEIARINNYIKQHRIDAVCFEITERKLSEYDGIAKQAIKACICFDEMIPDGMDVVISWDVQAQGFFNYARYPKTKFLLGPEYAILPFGFDYDRIKKRSYKSHSEVVLITMGGADEFNFAQQTVEALIKNEVALKANIILGPGYGYRKELEKLLASSPLRYELKENVTNMFEEYMSCDVAVATGGLTSYELLATRTPSALLAVYKHQVPRCVYFDKLNSASYLGYRDIDIERLLSTIRNPAHNMPEMLFCGKEEIYKFMDTHIKEKIKTGTIKGEKCAWI